MKAALGLVLFSLVTVVSATAGVNFDTEFSFDGKTYAWFDQDFKNWDHPLFEANEIDEKVKTSFDEQLQKRGLEKVNKSNADYILVFHTYARSSAELKAMGYQFRNYWTPDVVSDKDLYKGGTLVLDVVDAKTGKVVWRGSANKALPNNPRQIDRAIDRAARSLVRKFPPRA